MKAKRIITTRPSIIGVSIDFSMDELLVLRDLSNEIKHSQLSDETSSKKLAKIISNVVDKTFDSKGTLEEMLKDEDIFEDDAHKAVTEAVESYMK